MSKGAHKAGKRQRTRKADASLMGLKDDQDSGKMAEAAAAVRRNRVDQPPLPTELIALQQTAGNQAVRQLLAERPKAEQDGYLPGHPGQLAASPNLVQRIGVYPYLRPGAPASPSELGATPAQEVEALPEEIQSQHQAHLEADRLQEALDLVVQAMGRSRQINPLLLQTAVHPSRPPAP